MIINIKLRHILIWSLGFLVFLTSCRKDVENNREIIILTGDDISNTVTGLVKNDQNQAVSGAVITIGASVVTSDVNGYFYIENAIVNDDGFMIEVVKNNYTKGIYRALPVNGQDTYLDITLTSSIVLNEFLSSEGGFATDSLEHVRINIPANGLMDDSGNFYQGIVTAAVTWYDPSDLFSLKKMPGNLEGIQNDGRRVTLGSYGMFSAEFFGNGGEKLNLAPDQKANIALRIPEQMVSGAPEEIPTWSMDEGSGLWVEEGSASKDGNEYFFEVTHFSFWNCDAPFDLSKIGGTITFDNGSLVPNVEIRILYRDGAQLIGRAGYTNSRGKYCGKVPRNKDLEIQIYRYNCGALLYEGMIGRIEEESAQIDVVIPSSPVLFKMQGQVLDCDGNSVSNSAVFLFNQDGLLIGSTLSGGTGIYELYVSCPEENYYISAMDKQTYLQSEEIFIEATFEDMLGVDLVACSSIAEYISVGGLGNEIEFFAGFTELNADKSSIGLFAELPSGNSFQLRIENPQVGPKADVSSMTVYLPGAEIITYLCDDENDIGKCSDLIETTIEVYNDNFIKGFGSGALLRGGQETQVEFQFQLQID